MQPYTIRQTGETMTIAEQISDLKDQGRIKRAPAVDKFCLLGEIRDGVGLKPKQKRGGKIKFICNAVRWFDRVNGNTYHSVRVTRCRDGKVILGGFTYGYGEGYKQTALHIMSRAGWIPAKYRPNDKWYLYERESGYPILWNVSEGLKRECKANGEV